MTSIDEQFIEFIVKSLVGKPEDVVIERTIDEKGVLLELTVNPEDLGRVIGKRGATAQSMRTLLRALGTKNDARYNLKIVDNGVEGAGDDTSSKPARQDDTEDTSSDDEQVADDEEETVADEPVVEDDIELDDDDEADDEDEEGDDEEESLADKTRRELSDFDDLDI